MSGELKVGDRLRIRARQHVAGYQAAEKGTVLRGPKVSVTGHTYYVVRMDAGGPTSWTIFDADEIEPDVDQLDGTSAATAPSDRPSVADPGAVGEAGVIPGEAAAADEPVGRGLQVGDRVRLRAGSRVGGCQSGDTGTILHGPKTPARGRRYYLVALDRNGPTGTGVVFTEDQIEADS